MTTAAEAARIIGDTIESVIVGAPRMADGFRLAASPEMQEIIEDWVDGKIDLLEAQKRIVALAS